MLDKLGIVAELQANSLPLNKFTIRDRDEALLQITFDELPTAFRHILMLPQPKTEAILSARLEELGGSVRRNVRATAAAQEGDQVVVRLDRNGRHEEVRARFVVGADGMHSTVRGATNIQFEGEAYGQSFVLADVRMAWPLGQSEVSLCFSPVGRGSSAPRWKLPDRCNDG